MVALIHGRRRRFRLGRENQVHFWKRDGNHFTFIRDLSAADQTFARKTLAGWLGLPLEEVSE